MKTFGIAGKIWPILGYNTFLSNLLTKLYYFEFKKYSFNVFCGKTITEMFIARCFTSKNSGLLIDHCVKASAKKKLKSII